MKPYGLVLTILMLGMTAACASYKTEHHASSAERDLRLAEDDGVLIVGFEYDDSFFAPREGVRTMEFWEFDSEKRLWRRPAKGSVVQSMSRGNWFDGRTVYGHTELLLQPIPAGTYALAKAGAGDVKFAMEENTFAFTVRPGEVTYIGNLRFSRPTFVFVDVYVDPIGRTERYAEQLLSEYPYLPQTIRQQEPEFLALDCKADGFFDEPLELCSVPPPGAPSE
ncbi:MAG: hypothetical protein GY791_21305 [Alphaproteobacteria bacterium]|nr:hypothetical protein [Alphaproteobacteria bacterium]